MKLGSNFWLIFHQLFAKIINATVCHWQCWWYYSKRKYKFDLNQDNRDILNWAWVSSPPLLFWQLFSDERRLYGREASLQVNFGSGLTMTHRLETQRVVFFIWTLSQPLASEQTSQGTEPAFRLHFPILFSFFVSDQWVKEVKSRRESKIFSLVSREALSRCPWRHPIDTTYISRLYLDLINFRCYHLID